MRWWRVAELVRSALRGLGIRDARNHHFQPGLQTGDLAGLRAHDLVQLLDLPGLMGQLDFKISQSLLGHGSEIGGTGRRRNCVTPSSNSLVAGVPFHSLMRSHSPSQLVGLQG